MAAQRVGHDVFIDLGEVGGQAQAPAGAGNTGLAVDDDVGLDEAILNHRGQGQDSAGRVAARIGHQPGRFHLIPMQLTEAVDRLLQVGRVLVLNTVPLLVLGSQLQPKIGADVHNLESLLQRRYHRLGAGLVGQGREGQVQAAIQLGGDGEVQGRQVREHLFQPLAGGATSGNRGDLHLRVLVQDAGQLGARVSGHVDDANFHGVLPSAYRE